MRTVCAAGDSSDMSEQHGGKMKSEKDPLSGGGNVDPSTKMERQSSK
jgi:hypothetical protein